VANFRNDYTGGMHAHVLEAVTANNSRPDKGYGEDEFTAQAVEHIKKLVGSRAAEVHLVPSCTQANSLVPIQALRPCEAILSPETGHIYVHEAGALEAAGHKIIPIATTDGKLTPSLIREKLAAFSGDHMVVPRMVYLSNSTELGTVYTRRELLDIRTMCDEEDLLLYLDGARLGQAVATGLIDFPDVADCCDAFTIGCTKNGATAGEAVVLVNPAFHPNFRQLMKQRGAMLAKGKLLGVQLLSLFEDGLYLSLAQRAQNAAHALREGIASLDYTFFVDSPTNQIFPIFPTRIIGELDTLHEFYTWGKPYGDHATVRLVTSFETTPDEVQSFLADLQRIGG